MDAYNKLKDSFSKYCKLNGETLGEIEKLFKPVTIAKDEFFALEGETAKYFGYVVSGCLRMFNSSEDGKELTKFFLLDHNFFVGAINYGEINSVSIQAINKSEILIAEFHSLEKLVNKNHSLYEFKNKLVSEYALLKQKRENNYLLLDSEERYHLFLKEYPNLINQIPHYFIASYLGITSTQLSRIRKKISLR